MTAQLSVFAFNCGWFQCRPGFFIEGETGDYVRSPVPAYLIDHPKGRAMFDTGMGVRYRRELGEALPENKFGLQWFEGMDIGTRLRAIGVDPASIAWVVNSHFHIDHCGGNLHFPNATIVAQSREWEAASAEQVPGLYEAIDFDTGQPVKLIDGEHDLFGDGTVRIVPTHGHTHGHQSVIVRQGDRELLLAGDCCYTERNLDLRALPQATADFAEALRTLDRLAAARNRGARILFGHDARQWTGIAEGARLA